MTAKLKNSADFDYNAKQTLIMDAKNLEELGLNHNEAKVYLALISRGEASAIELIKATGFHRNIVYDNLEKLIEKGLVIFIFERDKRIFKLSKATAITEMLEKRQRELQEQLKKASQVTGNIQKLLARKSLPFSAAVYQGKNSIREILLEILEEKEYWGMGISNTSVEVLGEVFWKNYIQKVKQKKIRERLLLNRDFQMNVPLTSPRHTLTRRLSEQFSLITEILIYGRKVAVVIYTNPPIATVIESVDAVKSFKSYFETLWKVSDSELAWMDKMLENSKLTEEDAEEIGHKIKHKMFKRFERKFKQMQQPKT